MSKNAISLAFGCAVMLLQGCTQQPDPAKVQADVTKAEAEAKEDSSRRASKIGQGGG